MKRLFKQFNLKLISIFFSFLCFKSLSAQRKEVFVLQTTNGNITYNSYKEAGRAWFDDYVKDQVDVRFKYKYGRCDKNDAATGIIVTYEETHKNGANDNKEETSTLTFAPTGYFEFIEDTSKTNVVTPIVVKNEASSVYKHNYKYDERVLKREEEDPLNHKFPYSMDDQILATKPILKKDGYKIFQLEGTIKLKKQEKNKILEGVYEIGVTKDGIINHRFFRTSKTNK